MSDLQEQAIAAANAVIAEHGFPWALNEGNISNGMDSAERARLVIALAWTKGYGVGMDTMHGVVEETFAEMRP